MPQKPIADDQPPKVFYNNFLGGDSAETKPVTTSYTKPSSDPSLYANLPKSQSLAKTTGSFMRYEPVLGRSSSGI